MRHLTYKDQTTTGANIVEIRAPSQCFCHEPGSPAMQMYQNASPTATPTGTMHSGMHNSLTPTPNLGSQVREMNNSNSFRGLRHQTLPGRGSANKEKLIAQKRRSGGPNIRNERYNHSQSVIGSGPHGQVGKNLNSLTPMSNKANLMTIKR